MQSIVMTSVSQRDCTPKARFSVICAIIASFMIFAVAATPASAFLSTVNTPLQHQVEESTTITKVVVVRRGGVARRTTVVGPRGGVASRTVVRRGAVVRPRLSRRRRPLDSSWLVPMGTGHRNRGRCRNWIRHCSNRGGVGGPAAGAWLLLVLHRCEPDKRLLGRLPAIAV